MSWFDWVYFSVKQDGSVYTSGIDFQAKVRPIFSEGSIMVWHKPSATVWSGVGHRATSPAEYIVVRATDEDYGQRDGLRHAKVERIFEVSGQNWRQQKASALELARSLT